MLTVRYDRLNIRRGDLLLDLGAGFGRHAYQAAREGACVVALDYAEAELRQVRATFAAMVEAGDITWANFGGTLQGDATRLSFPDNTFSHIIISEVLEHIQDDVAAIREMTRILKPGGTLAVTVPTGWTEKINWMLSDEYHAPKSVGGHVRIYSSIELKAKLRSAGLDVQSQHHAHALHSPYWWLKCAVGPSNNDHPMVVKYRKLLEKDIIEAPKSTRLADKVLNPVLGKSYVVYSRKPTA
jgi:SAM-dependent methyltransferase